MAIRAISISFNKVLLARNIDLLKKMKLLEFSCFLFLAVLPSLVLSIRFTLWPAWWEVILFCLEWRAAVFFPLDVIFFPKPLKNVVLPSSDPFNGGSWPSRRCSVCGDPACDKVHITFIQLCIWLVRKPRAKENIRHIERPIHTRVQTRVSLLFGAW